MEREERIRYTLRARLGDIRLAPRRWGELQETLGLEANGAEEAPEAPTPQAPPLTIENRL